MRARRKCVPPRPIEYTLRHSRQTVKENDAVDASAADPDTTTTTSSAGVDIDADIGSPKPIVIKAEADPPSPAGRDDDAGSPEPDLDLKDVDLKPIVIKAEDPASPPGLPKLSSSTENGAEKDEVDSDPLAGDSGSRMVTLSDVTWQLFQQEKARVNPAMSDSMFVHWLLTNIRPSAYFQQHYRATVPPHQPPVMTPASGVGPAADANAVPGQMAAVGPYGPSVAATAASAGNNRLYCAICRKHFSSRAGLIQHQRGMHAWQPHFRCNKCGQRFRWASQLHDHRRKGYCPCVNLTSGSASNTASTLATGSASMVGSQVSPTRALAARPLTTHYPVGHAVAASGDVANGPKLTAAAGGAAAASLTRDAERDLDCASSNSPVEDELGDEGLAPSGAVVAASAAPSSGVVPAEAAKAGPAPAAAAAGATAAGEAGAMEVDMNGLIDGLGGSQANGATPNATGGSSSNNNNNANDSSGNSNTGFVISCPECAFSASSRESLEHHFKSDHVVEDLFSCTCGSDFPCLSLFLCHYIGCPIAATDLGIQAKEAGGGGRSGKETPISAKSENDPNKVAEGLPTQVPISSLANGMVDPALGYPSAAGLPGYPQHPSLAAMPPHHRLAMSPGGAGPPFFHIGRGSGMGRTPVGHEAVAAHAAAAAAAAAAAGAGGVAVGRPRAPNGQANCHFCHQTFSNKNTLKQHIIGMHSHEAQYHCEHCGKAFRWAPSYYTHRRKCGLALRGLGPSPRGRGRAATAAVGRY